MIDRVVGDTASGQEGRRPGLALGLGVGGISPAALETVAARLHDPADLAAHLPARCLARSSHLPEDEQSIADISRI